MIAYDSMTDTGCTIDFFFSSTTGNDNYGCGYDRYYIMCPIPCVCLFKRPDAQSLWPAIAEAFNLKCQLLISIMINVFAATFYRRAIFSKSGFVGRVAKRRKGK